MIPQFSGRWSVHQHIVAIAGLLCSVFFFCFVCAGTCALEFQLSVAGVVAMQRR